LVAFCSDLLVYLSFAVAVHTLCFPLAF
jgi:hypothetical protein